MNMTPMVLRLIIACVAIGIAFMITGQADPAFHGQVSDLLLLHPTTTVQGLHVWQVATYMWIHPTPGSLLLSLLFLWMFGPQFEERWGPRSFLRFFILSGIIAGVVAALVGAVVPYFDAIDFGTGASLNALLMAFAILFPQAQVRFYFFLPVTARQLVYVVVLIEVVMAAAGANHQLPNQLGGLFAGWLLITGKWRPSRWGILKSSGKPKRPNPGNLRVIKGDRDDDEPPKYLN